MGKASAGRGDATPSAAAGSVAGPTQPCSATSPPSGSCSHGQLLRQECSQQLSHTNPAAAGAHLSAAAAPASAWKRGGTARRTRMKSCGGLQVGGRWCSGTMRVLAACVQRQQQNSLVGNQRAGEPAAAVAAAVAAAAARTARPAGRQEPRAQPCALPFSSHRQQALTGLGGRLRRPLRWRLSAAAAAAAGARGAAAAALPAAAAAAIPAAAALRRRAAGL